MAVFEKSPLSSPLYQRGLGSRCREALQREVGIYPVIMAGGSGKRFWPLSRRRKPKHVIPIIGPKFLILQSVERVQPLSGWGRIYVVTIEEQWGDVASLLPDIPQENILCEPEGKNTASSIGLAALRVRKRDPEGVMVVLPADHYIRRDDEFRAVVEKGIRAAASGDTLVLLGIAPSRPETGYGYIEIGEPFPLGEGAGMFRVKAFHEKPNADRAVEFITRGNYLWNSGIFIWRASAILRAIERAMPELYGGLLKIDSAIGGPYERKTTREVYSALQPVSVDTGVLERLSDTLSVIRADFGWSDVGSFASLPEVWEKDGQGNVVKAHYMGVKSSENIILGGKRLIAAVGIRGMIIVDADDALLVCRMDHAQDVKVLVDELEKAGLKEYL